jgi:hypothetical protein
MAFGGSGFVTQLDGTHGGRIVFYVERRLYTC